MVSLQDGYKPIHYAARSDSRECVEALLTVTSDTWGVCEWTVDGVIEFMKSEQVLNLSFCEMIAAGFIYW